MVTKSRNTVTVHRLFHLSATMFYSKIHCCNELTRKKKKSLTRTWHWRCWLTDKNWVKLKRCQLLEWFWIQATNVHDKAWPPCKAVFQLSRAFIYLSSYKQKPTGFYLHSNLAYSKQGILNPDVNHTYRVQKNGSRKLKIYDLELNRQESSKT